jgi:hypothetical protein
MCGESDRKRRIDMSHDGPGSAHLHSPLTPQLRELTYVFLPFATSLARLYRICTPVARRQAWPVGLAPRLVPTFRDSAIFNVQSMVQSPFADTPSRQTCVGRHRQDIGSEDTKRKTQKTREQTGHTTHKHGSTSHEPTPHDRTLTRAIPVAFICYGTRPRTYSRTLNTRDSTRLYSIATAAGAARDTAGHRAELTLSSEQPVWGYQEHTYARTASGVSCCHHQTSTGTSPTGRHDLLYRYGYRK